MTPSHARRLGPRAAVLGLALAGLLLTLLAGARASRGDTLLELEDETNLSESPGLPSVDPAIAITTAPGGDARVHAVWEEDGDILHRSRLLPDGAWSATTSLYYPGQEPSLAAMGDELALAFTRGQVDVDDPNPTEIYTARWQAAGWSPPRPVQRGSISFTENGQQPDIAYDRSDGSVWLAWVDAGGGERTPYHAHLDGALQLQEGSEIRNTDGVQGPTLAVGPEGTVWAAWSETLSPDEQHVYLNSRPPGGPFDSEPRWLNASSQGRVPDVAVDQDRVCVVWQETLDEAGRNQEVFLDCDDQARQYNHSGTAGSRSLEPRLSLDDRLGALVVWQERGTGLRSIDFRPGPPPPNTQTMALSEGTVEAPAVSHHAGYAHAVWVDGEAENAEVVYARFRVERPTPTATASITPPPPSATPTITPIPTDGPSPTPTNTSEATPTPGGSPTPTPTADVPCSPKDCPPIFLPFTLLDY